MIPLGIALMMRGGSFPKTAVGWWPFFILGTFNNTLPFALIAWGQVRLESGLTTILTSLMPLVTVLLAHFFADNERLNRQKLVGVMLGLLGVLLLVGPTALAGITLNFWSQLAIIGSSFSYAGAAIFARKHLQAESKTESRMNAIIRLIALQYLLSTLTLLPFVLIFEQPWALTPSARSLGALLLIGLPITVGATLIYYYLIARVGPSLTASTIYLIPINGVLWGAILLGEQIRPISILALVIILLGVMIANRSSA